MPKIIPIKDMRDTAKISEMCHSTNEPIFVTKNGYGDMVILSIDAYEDYANRMRIHDEIMKGVEQADNGQLLDTETFMAELCARYDNSDIDKSELSDT